MNVGNTRDYERLSVLQTQYACKVFGVCWKGKHRRSGNPVVVRVVPIRGGEDLGEIVKGAVAFFSSYSGVVGMLGPSFICPCEGENEIWLIYKYVGTHQNLVERRCPGGGKESEENIIKILKQVLMCLAAAHSAGLYHCRIKASNVAVSPNYDVILLDHGLAYFEKYITTRLLDTSPYWTPPEALVPLGTSTTPHKLQLDIWGVGMLAYDLAAKTPLYEGRDPSRVVSMLKDTSRVVSLYALRGYSSEFHDFVASCLEKDPLSRPTCQQLMRDATFIGKSVVTRGVPKLYLGSVGGYRDRGDERPASAREHYFRLVRPPSQSSSAGPSPREMDTRRPPRSPQPEDQYSYSTTPPHDGMPGLPRCGSTSRSPVHTQSKTNSPSEQKYDDDILLSSEPSALLRSVISPAVNGVLDDVTAATARQLFDTVKDVQEVLLTVDSKWSDASHTFVKEMLCNIELSQVPTVRALIKPQVPNIHVHSVPESSALSTETMKSYMLHKYTSKYVPLLNQFD
eukprot:TRINITY_DN13907_c0_g1_i1.p1 TRINITY_DN13907_c0_g1~~TRINITY_DN13907_c0_g1_i1.p1  ORF type:complete len:511 (+),score=2.15 TRINITY_DN13907_c0_g1_i1:73-1605(+)